MKTGAEAIRALATQLPAFRQKLSDGWYQVRIAGRDVSTSGLTAQLHETLPDGAVIHIVPRVAGAKSGGVFQIVLGAAAIAGSFFTAGATLAAWGAAIGAGGMTGILFSLGASMVLGGVAQMLAPKARTPRTQTTDNGKQNTYFSSLDNMVAQGNVLPVLYGEMRVGSRVVARAFKSMWDSVLDIGRPDTAQEMLEKAEKAFDEADKKWQWYQSRSHRRGKTSAFLANLRGAWEDRANAQLGLSAATLQADLEKAREMAAKDWAESEASRLKYTEEAQKAYERLQTPLEKYTARQEELNKALKDGKILQADYNTLMAAAKKDYEATLKKPKQSGVKVSAGDRQEDRAHAALLTLQAELRTLEKHAGANEKISQQRRDLWKAENQFAVLEEAAQRRQLSAQEKSLLAHKDETLEYKRQLAALGDKVTYQEHLNALAQQADKFAQQQRAKRAAIDAKSRGLTDRQAAREATEQRLKEQYGDNPLALNNVMSEQKKTWAAEDQLRGSWMAGLKSGWSEWEESATDSMSQVKSAATQTFDGIAQNMAAMLTGSEQNWRSFTRSVLSMMTEILLKQAMVGIVGSIGSAIGGAASGGASASGGTAIQAAAAKLHFATGGFTGTGGKYEPAGIVHRGEFVFTKEATSRIGVGNLYRLMRGYATGGYVGGTGSPAQMRRSEGIRFEQNNNVVIQNDGTNGLPGPQMMKAVYDMARKGARDEIQAQMRDGGLFSGGGR